jgi:LPXTG-motif cell wall-anchored protein
MGRSIKKLNLLLADCVALLVAFPVLVQAADPGLNIGGSGAVSWNISNVKPGDSGIETLTLNNSSAYTCVLHIWISNIVNTEGLNPESETGNTAKPGELGEYLLFKTSSTSTALSTNIAIPALINNLPQSATDARYIKIDPFPAGQTVILNWEWELPAQTGNSVQGDSISFDINYLLAPATTTTPPYTLFGLIVAALSLLFLIFLLRRRKKKKG